MYSKIKNPQKNKMVSIYSKLGKSILNNYIYTLQYGNGGNSSKASQPDFPDDNDDDETFYPPPTKADVTLEELRARGRLPHKALSSEVKKKQQKLIKETPERIHNTNLLKDIVDYYQLAIEH